MSKKKLFQSYSLAVLSFLSAWQQWAVGSRQGSLDPRPWAMANDRALTLGSETLSPEGPAVLSTLLVTKAAK